MIVYPPDQEAVKKWGTLGYVSEHERHRIINLPYTEYHHAIKNIEREIADLKKKRRFWR
jgi:hypothetical protein